MPHNVLYLSRGAGFGHAMNDIIIIEQLKKLNPEITMQIASYAEGYSAFIMNGFPAIDLGLPVEQEFGHEGLVTIGALINNCHPEFIIADEVFMALPLARIFNIPALLITHWFFEAIDKKHFLIPYVKDAQHIIFVDRPDFHTIPPDFPIPVSFVGPIVREFNYHHDDKGKARTELNLADDDLLILVTPGGGHKTRIQLFELVICIFEKLNNPRLKLYLLTGPLYAQYSNRFKNNDRVIVKDFDWQIDRLMVASDFVIHKGTFSILWELAFLGIPSISIPDAKNMVDLRHAQNMARMNTTMTISPQELNPDNLLEKMNLLINSSEKRDEMSQAGKAFARQRGQEQAAQIINQLLGKTG